MRSRTTFVAAAGAALLLFGSVASAQTAGDTRTVTAEDTVAGPPHAEGGSVTPGWPWQQADGPPAQMAASSGIPSAPIYGAPAHWSAAPPHAFIPVDDVSVPRQSRWYGWQTLIADGASVAALVIGVTQDSPALAAGGLLAYSLAAPAVHAGHRRPLAALGSAGLRIGLPATGALIGSAASGCSDDGEDHVCNDLALAVGILIGAAGAIALDASALARDTVVSQPAARGVSLTPTLELRPERQVVGVQGAF